MSLRGTGLRAPASANFDFVEANGAASLFDTSFAGCLPLAVFPTIADACANRFATRTRLSRSSTEDLLKHL